jgi:hypothetical protein
MSRCSIFTSCENAIVVLSLAPARHGAAVDGPKPSSNRPYGINSPQMWPVRSAAGVFTPGL